MVLPHRHVLLFGVLPFLCRHEGADMHIQVFSAVHSPFAVASLARKYFGVACWLLKKQPGGVTLPCSLSVLQYSNPVSFPAGKEYGTSFVAASLHKSLLLIYPLPQS